LNKDDICDILQEHSVLKKIQYYIFNYGLCSIAMEWEISIWTGIAWG